MDRATELATSASFPPAQPSAEVQLPPRAEGLRRWQLPPTDPWAGYAKYTLLSALDERSQAVELPDVASFDDVTWAAQVGASLGGRGLPADTLWVVDLRGAASVGFGVGISRGGFEHVSLVPTFNNWPARREMVPAEETLAAMATMTPHLPDGSGSTHPVFLLDAWRLAYRDEQPDDDTYDNRYILSPSDFPDAAVLRAHGILRIVYLVENLSSPSFDAPWAGRLPGVEEDDLHPVFSEYETAGLQVAMIDLDVLSRSLGEADLDQTLLSFGLSVRPRVTILDEPWFFVRARGGFGGVRACPSSVRGGGWSRTIHGGSFGGYRGAGG
jgi:hypothetical protein